MYTHGLFILNIMKIYNCLLFTLFLIISCSSNTNTTIMNNEITPILVGKGWLQANTVFSIENKVIDNQEEWQQLLLNMNSINSNVTESFTEVSVDFDIYTIIAVFDIKNSSTTVDITAIDENDDNIMITVENLQKGITQDIAHPYHIIKIDKSGKPISFI